MENTGKVLFRDDTPQWYLAQGETWQGPLSASDVYQRVLDGQIGWADFVWRPGQTAWERICDIKIFQAAVPPLPPRGVRQEVKEVAREAAKPVVKPAARRSATPPPPPPGMKGHEALAPEAKEWFLFQDESQIGPFARSEIERLLKVGTVFGVTHAWKDGMENWIPLKDTEEFGDAAGIKKLPPKPPAFKAPAGSRMVSGSDRRTTPRLEQRSSPRRPLVAKILVTQSAELAVAVCRDISVGGMQVLTDRIPGAVGTHIKLNVSSVGSQKNSGIEPFVAEGVVVRHLEDGRGFSFRFERLSDLARKTIERYIQSGD